MLRQWIEIKIKTSVTPYLTVQSTPYRTLHRTVPYTGLYCTALYCIVHKDFLIEYLQKTHTLFQSRLWLSGLVSRLQGRVLLGCGENRVSRITATRVSPTLVLAHPTFRISLLFSFLLTATINWSI